MAPRKRKSVRKKPEPKPLSATVIKTLERKANNLFIEKVETQ